MRASRLVWMLPVLFGLGCATTSQLEVLRVQTSQQVGDMQATIVKIEHEVHVMQTSLAAYEVQLQQLMSRQDTSSVRIGELIDEMRTLKQPPTQP